MTRAVQASLDSSQLRALTLYPAISPAARVGRGLAYVPAAAHHDDYPSEQVEPSSPTR